jgi:hypothetical protein
MKDLFYYSIFAVILYFVLTAVFDNFTLEQENFDPSLVPVSSIITLAKVAQKLVNGNGTLTNPGNLQIGSSTSAPGNLTVTGNANINGTLTLGGTDIGKYVIDKINTLSSSLTTDALTVKGTANVTGDLTVKGTNILDTINSRATALENTLNNRVTTLDSSLNDRATDILNTLTGNIKAVDIALNNKAIQLDNSFKTKALEVNGTIIGTGATHFTGYGQDTWLPFTDGNNYLRNNVIIDQGNLSVTKNVAIGGNLNITGKLQFNGASAMIVKDFTGADLTYNSTYGFYYDTGISGNYQASIGWCRVTDRYEQYAPYLVWTGTWLFVVNNVRDNCCTKNEVKGIRVYAYHNNLFGF